MNIVCVGCSYTSGMPDNYYSWPEKLADLRPNDHIYNLSMGGSSLLFGIYLLEEFQKIQKIDKIIFQITHPHRFTGFRNFKLADSLVDWSSNYTRIDPDVRSKQSVLTITPSTANFKWTVNLEKIKFSHQYYRNYSRELGSIEYNIFSDYISKLADISFSYDQTPKKSREDVIDKAGHFSKTGHEIIARWINDELERNIH